MSYLIKVRDGTDFALRPNRCWGRLAPGSNIATDPARDRRPRPVNRYNGPIRR